MTTTNTPQNHQKPRQLERPKQAAQYLKIARSTLWHWAKTRHDFPKPIKAGGKTTLFDLTAINAWLDAQQEG